MHLQAVRQGYPILTLAYREPTQSDVQSLQYTYHLKTSSVLPAQSVGLPRTSSGPVPISGDTIHQADTSLPSIVLQTGQETPGVSDVSGPTDSLAAQRLRMEAMSAHKGAAADVLPDSEDERGNDVDFDGMLSVLFSLIRSHAQSFRCCAFT